MKIFNNKVRKGIFFISHNVKYLTQFLVLRKKNSYFCVLLQSKTDDKHSDLGLIHTRHFGTQFCNKKILRLIDNFEPHVSTTNQGKL